MEISIAEQTQVFLYSCLVGVALSVCYDVFSAFRLLWNPGRVLLFVLDVAYFLLCAAATFLFLLAANHGVVRLYIYIGEFLGWLVYHLTVGNFIMRLLWRLIRAVKKACSAVYAHTFGLLTAAARKKIAVYKEKCKNKKINRKKNKISEKKPLKQDANVLYNKTYHTPAKKRKSRGSAKKERQAANRYEGRRNQKEK